MLSGQATQQTNPRPSSRSVDFTVHLDPDEATWDSTLVAHDGHLMQSWHWGEFKRHEGWRVTRILISGAEGTGQAQVLFWPRGPMTTAFIPRGPLIVGNREAVATRLLPLIDTACRFFDHQLMLRVDTAGTVRRAARKMDAEMAAKAVVRNAVAAMRHSVHGRGVYVVVAAHQNRFASPAPFAVINLLHDRGIFFG